MSVSSFWSKSSSFFMKSQAVIDEMKRQTAIDDQEIQKLRSQVSQQMIIMYFMTIHYQYAISYLARVVSISAFFLFGAGNFIKELITTYSAVFLSTLVTS